MLGEWLTPLLEWTGLSIGPLLLLIIIIILLLKD